MTERANTPKLRFPEFNNDWTTNQAKNLFTNVSDKKHDGDLLVLSATQDKGMVPRQDLDLEIKYDKKNLSNYKRTLPNDFIISLRSFQGGFELNTIEGIVSPAYTVLRGEEELAQPKFFKQYFKSIRFIKKLDSMIYGIRDGKSISYKEFSTFSINYPSILEQQKIGDFFSKLDRQIELEEQKLEKLEEQKKGYMQKIFSQELRFKDENGEKFSDWQIITLGQLSDIKTGSLDANAMVPNGKYKFFTCARETYQIDKYAFDTEALLISGNGANVGYIHYYKGKFNAYQRTYVLDNIQNDINFIKYYLERYLIKRIYSEKRDGNTPYITRSTLYDMSISIPLAKLEQNKISNFFTKFDELIEKQNQKIDGLKKRKKGFLQKMFV